jgi:hypothetical protein
MLYITTKEFRLIKEYISSDNNSICNWIPDSIDIRRVIADQIAYECFRVKSLLSVTLKLSI